VGGDALAVCWGRCDTTRTCSRRAGHPGPRHRPDVPRPSLSAAMLDGRWQPNQATRWGPGCRQRRAPRCKSRRPTRQSDRSSAAVADRRESRPGRRSRPRVTDVPALGAVHPCVGHGRRLRAAASRTRRTRAPRCRSRQRSCRLPVMGRRPDRGGNELPWLVRTSDRPLGGRGRWTAACGVLLVGRGHRVSAASDATIRSSGESGPRGCRDTRTGPQSGWPEAVDDLLRSAQLHLLPALCSAPLADWPAEAVARPGRNPALRAT
jgi:hypothetical protein